MGLILIGMFIGVFIGILIGIGMRWNMTREEIIEHLDSIVGTYEILHGHGVNSDILDVDDIEAIKEAVSALSAIEDIKAEIIHYNDKHWNSEFISVGTVFAIIDKHMRGKADETNENS